MCVCVCGLYTLSVTERKESLVTEHVESISSAVAVSFP